MTRPSLAGIEPLSATPWTSRVTGTSNGVRVYDDKGHPLPGCFSCGENDAVYEPGDGALIAAAPALLAIVRDVLALAARLDRLAARHLDSETGRIETAVAHELRTTLAARLDLTDPEGDPT